MTHKEISFSDETLELVKSGAKTQTRSPVKEYSYKYLLKWLQPINQLATIEGFYLFFEGCRGKLQLKNPYTLPQDVLKVKDSKEKIRIKDIRIEKLYKITYDDCRKELGVTTYNITLKAVADQFIVLWQSIYGDTEYKYENNPLVWVIEFERVSNY